MARKILSAEVTIVALCKRGMNTLRTLYKADGVRLMAMVKAASTFEEKGELLAVVAVPGVPDAEGDEFTADAIEKAAHGFMRHGATLDLQHDQKPLGKDRAFVAESFVIQKGDPRFVGWKDYTGREVDVAGGWGMLVKIDDPALRKSYASGEWDGVSLFAPDFEAETLAKGETAGIASALRDAFVAAGLIKTNTATETEENEMSPEQIAALTKAVVDGVTAALKPAAPAADESKPEAIAFEGDPTNVADMRKHAAKIRKAALLKSGDLNDPAKIEALIAEMETDPAKERAELHNTNPTLAKALDAADAAAAEVARLRKSSNQAPAADAPKPDSTPALVKSARDVARSLNAERGFAAPKA